MPELFVRSEASIAVTSLGEFRVFAPNGAVLEVEGDAKAFSAFWSFVGTSRSKAEIKRELSSFDAVSLFDSFWEQGILVGAEVSLTKIDEELPVKHLLLVVAGSFFAHQAPILCEFLRAKVAKHVDVILTEASKKFVSPYVFQHCADTCFEEYTDKAPGIRTAHADLAERADLVLVWPATAHTISKLAHGASSDLASTALLASDAPAVVAPAMNPIMWRSLPVQRNIALIREYGFQILEPVQGLVRRKHYDVGSPVGAFDTSSILREIAGTIPRRRAAHGTK